MSTTELFRGLQVLTAALGMVAFAASLLIGDHVAGVWLTGVGMVLLSVATGAALAVVAIEPAVLTGCGDGSRTV